jgi:hypothetical protein
VIPVFFDVTASLGIWFRHMQHHTPVDKNATIILYGLI